MLKGLLAFRVTLMEQQRGKEHAEQRFVEQQLVEQQLGKQQQFGKQQQLGKQQLMIRACRRGPLRGLSPPRNAESCKSRAKLSEVTSPLASARMAANGALISFGGAVTSSDLIR